MAVKGVLEVHLIEARALKSGDTFLERMDPYVILRFRGQERKSRVLREGGDNPRWNETFTFQAEYPAADGQHKLIFKLMDEDTFSDDDFIGSATLNVGDLIAAGAEMGSAELSPRRYRVVLSDRTYHGEILVGVVFRKSGGLLHDTKRRASS